MIHTVNPEAAPNLDPYCFPRQSPNSKLDILRHQTRRLLGKGALVLAFAAGLAVSAPPSAEATFVDDYPNQGAANWNPFAYEWWVDENGNGQPDVTPAPYDNDELMSSRGYFYRNCTDGASYWVNKYIGKNPQGYGNAADWDTAAVSQGHIVLPGNTNDIEVGDVAQSDSIAAPYGHVGFVTSVSKNSSGVIQSFTTREMNWDGGGNADFRTYSVRNSNGKFKYNNTAEWDHFIDFNGLGVGMDGDSLETSNNRDFNLDNKDDVAWYESGNNGTITALISTGTSFFPSAITSGFGPPTWAGTGDFNGDGRSDIAWYHEWNHSLYLLKGNANGTWSAGPVVSNLAKPDWADTGDFNLDGKDDIAWYEAQNNGGTITALVSTGTSFSPSAIASGYSQPTWAGVGDFNDDKRSDIAWYQSSNHTLYLLKGNINGAWAAGPVVSNLSPPDWAATTK